MIKGVQSTISQMAEITVHGCWATGFWLERDWLYHMNIPKRVNTIYNRDVLELCRVSGERYMLILGMSHRTHWIG